MSDAQPSEGEDVGAAVVNRGEADSTEARTVESPVCHRAPVVGAEGRGGVHHLHLLQLLHDKVEVKVARCSDSKTLHILVDKKSS